MKTIAIAGVGLIGGSFALALRKAGFSGEILGVSSPASLRLAMERKVIDRGASLDEAVEQADVIYLAQPIRIILETLEIIGKRLHPETLVTDAGSTKNQIVACAESHLPRGQFLGAHPMAGKESRGVAEADADLFQNRPYVVTPRDPADLESQKAQRFLEWIPKIGARLVQLDPEQHDRLVAYTSHLPQLISTALAATISGQPDAPAVAGPAVLGLTRLALSPYEIWRDIFETNPRAIDQALAAFIARLEFLRQNLTSPEVETAFRQAADCATILRRHK